MSQAYPISLCFIKFSDYANQPALMKQLFQLLSLAEQHKAKQFHFDQDRSAYVIAHACLRKLLVHKLPGFDVHDLNFSTNDYGKPFLPKQHIAQFNLSHTRQYGLIAFCPVADIYLGADVEYIQRNLASLALAERFFHPEEYVDLLATKTIEHGEVSKPYFFQLWTAKEAFVKAIGQGISFGLANFQIKITQTQVDSSTANTTVAHLAWLSKHQPDLLLEQWRFRYINPADDHVACIAYNGQLRTMEYVLSSDLLDY